MEDSLGTGTRALRFGRKSHIGTRLLASILMLFVAAQPGFGRSPKLQRVSSGVDGQQSALRGKVVDRVSRKALSGVHVRLIPLSPRNSGNLPSLRPDSPDVVYGALSTKNGGFSIKSVAAGAYFIQAEKAGFEALPFRQRGSPRDSLIVVTAGQIVDVELEMAQWATITGTVLDFYDEPMPDVGVEAIALAGQPNSGTHQTSSDDNGNFRLTVPPGRYYVVAHVAGPTAEETEAIRADGTEEREYRNTYYPNSPSAADARPVTLGPGERIDNVDIRLLSGTPLSISGVVTGLTDDIKSVTVTIESGKSSKEIHHALSRGFTVNGSMQPFSFSRLQPGFYRVSASAVRGDQQLKSKVEDFTVDQSPLRGLALELVSASSARGAAKIQNDQSSTEERKSEGVVVFDSLSGGIQPRPLFAAPTDGRNLSDAPRASVAGVVTDAITSQPLVHVQMTLTNLETSAARGYRLLTDLTGHFSIGELPPGQYLISMNHRKYSEDPDSIHQIKLNAGETVRDLNLKLFPPATITGRVFDETGAPMEGITVQAQSQLSTETGLSDEHGEFRIGGLRPGSYRILAIPHESRLPPEVRTDGSTEVNYTSTYYPGALDKPGASRILLRAGTQVADLEIQLRAFPILRVSGWVSGVPKDGDCAGLTLNHDQSGFGVPLGAGRRFTIWRLSPGSYTLSAQCHDLAGHTLASGVVPFDLSSTHVDNLELRVASLFSLAGKIELDDFGQTSRPSLHGTFVRLSDQRESTVGMLAPVGPNGAFQFVNVTLGRYWLTIVGFPLNAYVKSVQVGLADSTDGSIDLRSGPPRDPIAMIVGKAEGRISGTVLGPKALVPRAVVVLIDRRLQNPFSFMFTVSAGGDYRFDGVPPGRYDVIAIDQAQVPSLWQEPDLERYQDVIEHIELADGDVITRDVNLSVPNPRLGSNQ